MPKVDYRRPEVAALDPSWLKIRHCLGGSPVIKEHKDAYLIRPNASDLSKENLDRYAARLKRAVFYNVTGRTHTGLVGRVFSKEPSIEFPSSLAPLLTNVDGAGTTLNQQAKACLGLNLAYGAGGLLTDYPDTSDETGTPRPTTRRDQAEGKISAIILYYEPWNIINWRHRVVGSSTLLSLVVLAESYLDKDDGFEPEYKPQFRVLRLDEETGNYTVEIYKEVGKDWVSDGVVTPTGSGGKPLKEIPFSPFGAENNEITPDQPPLLDMAELNIAHYNDSADHQDSMFYVGQPMYVFSGLTENWVKTVLKGEIAVGSAKAVLLPTGATGNIIQPDPNTMAMEGMEHKEKQMKALGAKLVEDKTVQRTATEAGMEEDTEMSVVTSAANNVSAAYVSALRFAAMFIGETNITDDNLAYELNTDLGIGHMTAQERAQLIAEWQGGAMDWEEYRWNMRRAGLVFKDDDKVKDEIAADAGTGNMPPGEADEDPDADEE